MKAEIKSQWLAALRSGKYSQTREVLRSIDGGHCCLGVLCDILEPKAWCGGHESHPSSGYSHTGSFHLPKQAVLDEAGLNRNPSVQLPRDHVVMQDPRLKKDLASLNQGVGPGPVIDLYLTTLNDTGFSFLEIADFIEKYIPGEDTPANSPANP